MRQRKVPFYEVRKLVGWSCTLDIYLVDGTYELPSFTFFAEIKFSVGTMERKPIMYSTLIAESDC